MTELERLFLRRTEELVAQVVTWAEPHEWVTKRYPKRMRDESRQIYEIPALFLQKGPIRLLLDPVACDSPGSEAVLDLYVMPTYDDMATLFWYEGGWHLHYAFPSDSPAVSEEEALDLTEESLLRVLESIFDHAVP